MPQKSPDTGSDPAAEALADIEEKLTALSELEAISNLNVLVLGVSPALAATNVYMSNAHSLSILYENAVEVQREQSSLSQESLKSGLALLRALSGGSAKAASEALDPDQTVIDLLKALKAAR